MKRLPEPEIGFVYILSNESLPGLLKIGFTSLLAEDRAKDLFTTGLPTEFKVEFRVCSSYPRAVERRAHEIMESCRLSVRREFFKISLSDAINSVRQALTEAAGISQWECSQPVPLLGRAQVSLNMKAGEVFALIAYQNIGDLLTGKPDVIDLWQAHSNGDTLEIFTAQSPAHIAGFSDGDPGSEEDPVPYLDRDMSVRNGMINGRERLMPGDRLVWLPSVSNAMNQSYVIFDAKEHCQVVSRTWKAVTGPHGFPYILNDFTYDNVWPEAQKAVKEALKMPVPRTWAPRDQRGEEWMPIGVSPQPPEYWLEQLGPRQKRKKKTSPASYSQLLKT
ncbi:MAG: GIY-YIG nuclease family protein [Gammaproteobacteria bacterium]